MSKHQRKPAKAQPISANPLFPAVVALWFGAAFGLGSLAVRPSLLEDLVLKSHIDLVIPAAAPPLGITARILLALVLAAFGALIGIALARRLARPKVVGRERKRGARDLSNRSPRVRNRDAHPDAPARRPISAHEEFGDEEPFEVARPAAGLIANRRRSLAMAEEDPRFVPHEAAPLPGLDPVQPLDLASLALPVDQPVAAAPSYAEPVSAPAPALDWAQAAPLSAVPAATAAIPTAMVPVPLDTASHPAPVVAEATQPDGRQVFGMTPPPAPEAAPRQVFGLQAEGDHAPQDFAKAAGFETPVADTAEPPPMFERLGGAADASGAPSETVAPPQLQAAPQATAPTQAEPLPSPSSLGMTDLAARLADSMRRRRERASAAVTPAAISAAPEPQAPAPEPAVSLAPAQIMPEVPAMPAAFAAPAAPIAAPAEPVTAPAPALAVPAAMRPLALDAFLEDDAGFADTSLLPPRHIAMPAAVQPAAPFAPPAAPLAAQAAAPADEPESTIEQSLADAAEDNPYASLLEVAPVRQAHVRIDEPEPAVDAVIEPVVIFPGQTGQVVSLAPAASQNGGEDGAFRRFDAPGSAGQGQPVACGTSASLIPAEEAAQALRAALSNLQRMSGAA